MEFPIFSNYSKKIPKKGSGLYYDPVYGYVPLPSYVREAMDLDVFQRLRGIKQLSTVYLTFPGAVHTRFDHCVGVSHLASLMANKLRELVSPNDANSPKINSVTEACMKLSSLFHDIGHGPFCHIFEMFCRRIEEFKSWDHESFANKLITGRDEKDNELAKEEFKQIPKFLANLKHNFSIEYGDAENLALLDPKNIFLVGLGKPPDLGDAKLSNKYYFLKDIIASSYGLDRLDYLKRDAYFSGVITGNLDIGEIISNLLLKKYDNKYQLCLKSEAATALETLLQARNLVYRRLYHNSVNRSAQELIIRALMELKNEPEDLCLLTDDELLFKFFEIEGIPGEIRERIKFRVLFENLPICNHLLIKDFKLRLDDYKKKPDQWKILRNKEDSIAKKAGMDKGKVFYDIEIIPAVRIKDFTEQVFFDEVEAKPKSLFDLAKHLDAIYGKDVLTGQLKHESFNDSVSTIYTSFPFDEIEEEIEVLTKSPADNLQNGIKQLYEKKLRPLIYGFFDEILQIKETVPEFYENKDVKEHLSLLEKKYLNYLNDLVELKKAVAQK